MSSIHSTQSSPAVQSVQKRTKKATRVGDLLEVPGIAPMKPQPLDQLWAMRLLVKEGGWIGLPINGHCPAICSAIPAWAPAEHRLLQLAQQARKTDAHALDAVSTVADLLDCLSSLQLITPEKAEEVPLELITALEETEKQAADGPHFLSPMAENMALFQSVFSLTEEEVLFLAFATFAGCRGSALYRVCDMFDCSAGLPAVGRLFACATGIDDVVARRIVTDDHGRGVFRLLQHNCGRGDERLANWLATIGSFSFADFMKTRISKEKLQSAFATPAGAPELAAEDFSHVPEAAQTLMPYLAKALADKRAGVNVLLYGDPGTGKTQLTRVIGRELGASVLEVSCRPVDSDEEKVSRLRVWENAGLCLEADARALLVMDECEDIFLSELKIYNDQPVRDNKAEINRLLETNPHPTIWLTNSLAGMDAAMLRRYDIVLEVTQPTCAQRRRIVEKLASDLLSESLKDRLARTQKLSPGILAKTLSVVKALDKPQVNERDEKALLLINAVLTAQKAGQVAPAAPLSEAVYDNTDINLARLTDGLRQSPSARLCLYGAPGTGKSAYAAWLAQALGKPLLTKKASDLLSPWVGGTEANIAAAFREASQDNAVLLIDEADSFLQDRTRSVRSWETTQVNEMLTQMEQFDGIFIAATNLIDTLDPASLRRFDLKAEFKCLQPAQRRQLFSHWIETLKLAPDDKAEDRIAALANLTPGDFAAIARQSKFNPVKTAEDFAQRLCAKCRLKDVNAGSGKSIGFC